MSLLRIPGHLAVVVLAMLLAVGNDRTAATFAIGGTLMFIAWGWGPVGALIAVYGVILWLGQTTKSVVERRR